MHTEGAQAGAARTEAPQGQRARDAEAGAAEAGKTPDEAAGSEAPQTADPQAGAESEPEKAASKASKAGEAASLKTKVEQLEKKLAESKDTLLRTAAEYENFRKRSAREHDAAFDNGVSFSVTALLPVLDTLELAASAETADESYKKGVLMTLEQCHAAFDKMGVKEIEALGKPFDPELHAAVMQQPATEEMPSGTVTQVMQKGYLLHDKVVRHAMVAVAE
ncbi:MAG: nucleotide exchange factor GrpE [Subdoligranulum sp.]|nr:nucleotide exchange factor GrpE [Subdoligranulum sp.]